MIKKLLVIDDEPDICQFICDVADDMGFSTAKTYNSLEFPLLYSTDLDCIIMDLSMPDMDGIELIRFLGDNQCNADIIVVSGMDESIISTANRLARDHGLNVLGPSANPLKSHHWKISFHAFHYVQLKKQSHLLKTTNRINRFRLLKKCAWQSKTNR